MALHNMYAMARCYDSSFSLLSGYQNEERSVKWWISYYYLYQHSYLVPELFRDWTICSGWGEKILSWSSYREIFCILSDVKIEVCSLATFYVLILFESIDQGFITLFSAIYIEQWSLLENPPRCYWSEPSIFFKHDGTLILLTRKVTNDEEVNEQEEHTIRRSVRLMENYFQLIYCDKHEHIEGLQWIPTEVYMSIVVY